MHRKVLYSPGFGAGWSTWNCQDTLTDDYLYLTRDATAWL